MSHRYTPVKILQATGQIQTTSAIWSVGSCFSDHMASRLEDAKFDTLANPFGVLYNPISIANALKMSRTHAGPSKASYGSRGEIFFCYDCHSELSALSFELLSQNIATVLHRASTHLQKASHLLITLGTAIVYELSSTGQVVANCHKMPQELFKKRLLSIEECFQAMAPEIGQLSDKQIIITVSPIRHTREGLVSNQRSKARLIEVAHKICDDFKHVQYFPAYELLLDELRDYRYFASDLIHPSAEAIDIVWERFQQAHLSDAARKKVDDVGRLTRALRHRPQFPESAEHQAFLHATDQLKENLRRRYPEIKL